MEIRNRRLYQDIIRTSLIKERASSPRHVLSSLAVVIRSSWWMRQDMMEINQVVYA